MNTMHHHLLRLRPWLTVCLLAAVLSSVAFAQEASMSSDEYARLDSFESHTLINADKVFADRQFRRAAAEYDAFLLEFPRSEAIAYALLRKGRSLHLDDKRFQAIKVYTEVLDYFPDSIKYAAAALYHTGEAHHQNGDIEEAMKAWAELADDEDYSKQPLAADAINRLADNLMKQGKVDRAVAYYEQVAVDFRRANADAARDAIRKVIPHYVRRQMDQPGLRAFYEKVESFDHHPRNFEPDVEKDHAYWRSVQGEVSRYGGFNDLQVELRDRYYGYWAKQAEGRFPADDSYQIELARWKRIYEGDVTKWMQRLDSQFDAHQKEGDYSRIIRWIVLFAESEPNAMSYYNKLRFDKMSNGQIQDLLLACFDQLQNRELARNTFEKFRFDEMSDSDKYQLTQHLWHRDWKLFRDVCMRYQDQAAGKMRLLSHLHWQYMHRRNQEAYDEGIPLTDELVSHERYAKQTLRYRGDMFSRAGEYEKAIQAYQLWDSPPEGAFLIAECYRKLGKLEPAVGQLREIENFFNDRSRFGDTAARAAMTAADYYRDAGDKTRYVAELRKIMQKYPQSGQSSTAHQALEEMGIKIGGGVDAD